MRTEGWLRPKSSQHNALTPKGTGERNEKKREEGQKNRVHGFLDGALETQ